jgi:DNA-directed RNA polymerase subunit RPC12/RpoP
MKVVEDLGVIFPKETSKRASRHAIYECSKCSIHFRASVSDVKRYKQEQCRGCSKRTHGESKTKLYGVWTSIKDRCFNEKCVAYSSYGEVGITMCDEWANSYIEFRDWALANGYSELLSLDRIDNKKGYSPNNCRYANREVQNANQKQISKNNTTGYKGVVKHTLLDGTERYVAQINYSKNNKHIGTFSSKEEAANAYNEFILENNLPHTINQINRDYRI